MKRRLIVRVVIHALDDIDFPSSRPVRSCICVQISKKRVTAKILHTVTPKGRPCTAPCRHVNGVHDEKTTGEVILGLYPDALAVARDSLSSFYLHDHISGGIRTNESVALLQVMTNYQSDGSLRKRKKKLTASCMSRKSTVPMCIHTSRFRRCSK